MNIIQLKKIAYKYASALAEIILEESIILELKFVEGLVAEPRMRDFLKDPLCNSSEKKDRLLAALGSYVSKPVENVLLLLIEKNRANLFPFLCETYKNIYYEAKGIVIADVAAPTPLDSAELATLKVELERLTSKMVQFGEVTCDRTLLAGLRVTIDDRRIDFSVKSALHTIRKDLLANL